MWAWAGVKGLEESELSRTYARGGIVETEDKKP